DLKFRILPCSTFILIHQPIIWIRFLRIFIEHLHVGMRRRGIQIVINFLYILTMIAFIVGESKISFLDDGIFFIPESQCKAKQLFMITNAGNAFLSPPVAFASCFVVANVIPGVSIGAIVFPNGSPLAVAEV